MEEIEIVMCAIIVLQVISLVLMLKKEPKAENQSFFITKDQENEVQEKKKLQK